MFDYVVSLWAADVYTLRVGVCAFMLVRNFGWVKGKHTFGVGWVYMHMNVYILDECI